MSTKLPVKSILKQSTTQTISDEAKEKAAKKERNMTIALNHATRIDAQKKIQAHILRNIETLMELPSSTTPSAIGARTFVSLIHPFQPSDFASLIEERRIAGRCGYALCANPPRSETLRPSASWKLKGTGAGDFCSTECVRKAVYVKAQLSETPAWERVEGQQAPVVLPEGDRPGWVGDRGGGGGDGAQGRGMRVGMEEGKELAAERGEEIASFKPRQVMRDSVFEKPSNKALTPPSFPQRATNGSGYGTIEGYESKFVTKRDKGDDDSDSDDGDVEAAGRAQGTEFESEIRTAGDDAGDEGEGGFGEEEEAAWREMQAALREMNTTARHNR